MTAINAYKEHPCNLIDGGVKEKYLRVASIYGANASGKSNLIYAMRYFQKIIMQSMNNVADSSDAAINKFYVPFLFEENYDNSEFEMVVVIDEYEYRYGFEYNAECIVTEWLYRKSRKTNRTVTILERTTETIQLGASVRKECEPYKNQIPSETLVLTFFNKLRLKTDVFKIVFSGIMANKVALSSFDYYRGRENRTLVFDKDDFADFDEAVKAGKRKGYHIAWSNESFEYWLYLHFQYNEAALHRHDWSNKLNEVFNEKQLGDGKYSKNCKNIFEIMKEINGVDTAIRNLLLNFSKQWHIRVNLFS